MPKSPKWNEGPCPFCKEPVAVGAAKCPRCQSELSAEQQQAIKNRQKGGLFGCAVLIPALIIGVWSCSDDTPAEQAVSSLADSARSAPIVPATPQANYAEQRKGVYYYTSALSENAKANGQVAGDVIGFRYLGKNSDGEHRLASVEAGAVATCGEPCSIIHLSDGQSIAFSPDSVIGAAFTDAINGRLVPAGGQGSRSE